MPRRAVLVLCAVLASCTAYEVPREGEPARVVTAPAGGGPRSAADFRRVRARIEPVAEAFCREEVPSAPASYCNFAILLETDPRMPPNAFQTRSEAGRPVIVVGARLLDEMRSDDEIAFVLAHEASHHVADHLTRQQQSQVFGALVLGGIVAATGGPYADPELNREAIQNAMDVGAFVGGRAYSQRYELEADWLGSFVTARAGYDPLIGAQVFVRPSLASSGGPVLLSTHPGSPQRLESVARASAEIQRQQAQGQVPRPARSSGLSF